MGVFILIIIVFGFLIFVFCNSSTQMNNERIKIFLYHELNKAREFTFILNNKDLNDAYEILKCDLKFYSETTGILFKEEKGQIKTQDGTFIDCILIYQENHKYSQSEIQFIFTLESVGNVAFLRVYSYGDINNNNYVLNQENKSFSIAILACADTLIEDLEKQFKG